MKTKDKIKNARIIKDYEFYNYAMSGVLFLQKCKSIGGFAFQDCKFKNAINLPKCRFIGNYAFYNSEFQCVYNLLKCERIEECAFYNSWCTGELNIPRCKFLGGGAFFSSHFSKIVMAEHAVLEDYCIGDNSKEFIEFYKLNNKKAGTYVLIDDKWCFYNNHR